MVEVTPRSSTFTIRYERYLLALILAALAFLIWFFWAIRSPWGGTSSSIEPWQTLLSSRSRTPKGAKQVDNLGQNLRIHRVIRQAEKRYAVMFSVTDANASPLTVVQKSDVQIKLKDSNGNLQSTIIERITPLHQLSAFGERAHFSCVMDWSGSMFDSDLQALKDNYSSFFKALSIPYAAAVYKFETNIHLITGLSSDPAVLENAVRKDIKQGSTALYAAIDTAIKPIQKAPWLRFQLITTDGMDNIGGATLEDVIKRARANEISLFVLGFGWVHVDILERLAEQTDGYYIYVPDSDELATWFTRLAAIINNIQVAEVTAPFDLMRPNGIEITIRCGSTSLNRTR